MKKYVLFLCIMLGLAMLGGCAGSQPSVTEPAATTAAPTQAPTTVPQETEEDIVYETNENVSVFLQVRRQRFQMVLEQLQRHTRRAEAEALCCHSDRQGAVQHGADKETLCQKERRQPFG